MADTLPTYTMPRRPRPTGPTTLPVGDPTQTERPLSPTGGTPSPLPPPTGPGNVPIQPELVPGTAEPQAPPPTPGAPLPQNSFNYSPEAEAFWMTGERRAPQEWYQQNPQYAPPNPFGPTTGPIHPPLAPEQPPAFYDPPQQPFGPTRRFRPTGPITNNRAMLDRVRSTAMSRLLNRG